MILKSADWFSEKIRHNSSILLYGKTWYWVDPEVHEDADLGVVEPIRQRPWVQTLPVWSVTSSGPFGPGQGEADQKADPDLDLFHRLSTRAILTQMQKSRMSKTILMKPVFCFSLLWPVKKSISLHLSTWSAMPQFWQLASCRILVLEFSFSLPGMAWKWEPLP